VPLGSELHLALSTLMCAWRMHVRALPAERVNLAQIFPVLIREKSVPMPQALVDFCYMMSIASVAPTDPADPALIDVLAEIAGGRLSFDDKHLVFRPEGNADMSLPISATASLIKSIAGLRVFLSTAVRGDVIIIDEPEMCAHPDAQIALTELFAIMVKRGIHVVLATHSPYVVDHLSTLVEASRLEGDARARIVQKLRLRSDDALLAPEQLAVYRFDPNGEVTPIFDPETRSIDPSTFSDVGDAETNLFSDVLATERRHGN